MPRAPWWAIGLLALVIILFGTYWYEDEMKGYPPSWEQQANNDPLMVGTWRSSTDPKFTREFRASGDIVDRYGGKTSFAMQGSMTTVDPTRETIVHVPAGALAGMTVLKFRWRNGQTTYAGVKAETASSLTLVDLPDNGTVTTYMKVP